MIPGTFRIAFKLINLPICDGTNSCLFTDQKSYADCKQKWLRPWTITGSQFVRSKNKFSSFKTHFNFSVNPSFLDFLPLIRIARILFAQHTKQSICFSLTGVCVAILEYGHVTKISRDDGLLSEPTTEVNGNEPVCKRVPNNQSDNLPLS